MTSPIHILRESIIAVPAVKYALGIGGIVATISIAYSLRIDPRVAVIGTLVTLLLMTVLVVFSRMASVGSARAFQPALVLTWFSLVLFIAVSGTLFSCVFFGTPRDLSSWLTGRTQDMRTGAGLPYVSEFVATLPMNSSFDEVCTFFEKE